jgi:glutathione S-transferase
MVTPSMAAFLVLISNNDFLYFVLSIKFLAAKVGQRRNFAAFWLMKRGKRMVVYGSSLAPAVRKVLAFIGEKGLAPGEHRPIAPQDDAPDFRRASPFGHIPAFSDGDVHICDSTAICHYLERKYPHPALFPASPAHYGRMVWLDQFADNFIGTTECKVVTARLVKKMRGETPDEETATHVIAHELPPLLAYLEKEIAGPFLVGDRLSLADLAVVSPFASLAMAGFTPDAAQWPKLRAYLDRILARPALAVIRDP